jgi:hypothetical protein
VRDLFEFGCQPDLFGRQPQGLSGVKATAGRRTGQGPEADDLTAVEPDDGPVLGGDLPLTHNLVNGQLAQRTAMGWRAGCARADKASVPAEQRWHRLLRSAWRTDVEWISMCTSVASPVP